MQAGVRESGVQVPPRQRLWRAVPGVLLLVLVLWFVATGRWGSYLGFPDASVYVADVVLAVVVVLTAAQRRVRAVLSTSAQWPVGLWWMLAALLTWSVVRLLAGGRFGQDALRDFAPFAYIAVAFLAFSLRPRVSTGVARAAVLLAIAAHTAWLTWSNYDTSVAPGLPVWGPVHIFEIRTDFDAAMCGVSVAVLVAMLGRGTRWILPLLLGLAGWNAYLVLHIDNRAGLLGGGAAVAVLLVGVLRRVFVHQLTRPWQRITGAVLLAGLAVGLAVPVLASPAVQKLGDTFGGPPSSVGQGTAQARRQVWTKVEDYLGDKRSRSLLGVGFGPNYLATTGAEAILEGTTYSNVRAPHNFAINTWARLGAVAAILQLLLVAYAAWLAVRAVWVGGLSPLGQLAVALAVALPIAAFVGVILESPFGAVPYYWAVGTLAAEGARRHRRGRHAETAPVV